MGELPHHLSIAEQRGDTTQVIYPSELGNEGVGKTSSGNHDYTFAIMRHLPERARDA